MQIMSTLTLQIPDDLKQQLEELGRQRQQTTVELVRESLRRYLAQEELLRIRENLRPYAEKQGLLTDEDVFKVVS